MLINRIIKESLFSLKRNKMRTFLSTLGIIIGIASVITLLSLGVATQSQITSQIESLGANRITLNAGRGENVRDQNSLTMEDVKFLRQDIFADYSISVMPKISSGGTATYQGNSSSISLTGVDEVFYQNETNLDDLEFGRALSEEEIVNKAKVMIIGSQVASDLFGTSQNALYKELKFQNQFWQVVGVLAETESLTGTDTAAYTPIGAVALYVPGASLKQLSSSEVTAVNSEAVTDTQNLVKYAFMKRRNLTEADNLNLRIFSAKDMIETMNTMLGTVTGLLAGIAAISLLVGGIGIMNIMLVSVTERTREIGLRKALGAKRKTVIFQFLTESVILTLIGGFCGFLLGILLAWLGTKLMEINFVISWWAVILSITASTFIGLVFGIYPAAKAAKLQPIEALRYD
jgi:putative ABC transport system permease protein